MNLDIFIPLLFAHVLGDFLLQTDKMVANKARFPVLLLHAFIITLTSAIALWEPRLLALAAAVGVLHLLIDLLKIHCLSKKLSSLAAFLTDQALHLAVLLFASSQIAFVSTDFPPLSETRHDLLVLATGAILTIFAGSYLISSLVEPFLKELATSEQPRGLDGAGKLIGYLERSLIFLLVLVGQPAAVSFLIAAKSIFRFGELKDPENRREAEYITIGTLASFAWALALSILTHHQLS